MLTKLFPPKTIELPNGKVVIQKRSMTPITILAFIVLIYISVQITDFDLQRLAKRINQFFFILKDMVPQHGSICQNFGNH